MPIGGPSFSSVRKAREAIRERAKELIDLQITIIKAALTNGDFETAAKANQFLLEHTTDEDDTPLLAPSVDKAKIESTGTKGPSIHIGGIIIGGLGEGAKSLPEPSIEAQVVKVEPGNKD